jgi:hypothetical protein
MCFSAALQLLVSFSARAQDDVSKPTDKPKPFVLAIHIATSTPEDSDLRIAAYIEAANKHFEASGISFMETVRTTLPSTFTILETQKERHLLKKYFVPNTINVFVLDEIDDPTPSEATKKAAAWQGRKPTGRLAGAHIEYKSKKPGTYIILSKDGNKLTLTHELGHFFGTPHSKDPANIMSYGADRQRFSEKQIQTFRTFAKRFRKQHILKSES